MNDAQLLTWCAKLADQNPVTLRSLQNYGRLCGATRRQKSPIQLDDKTLWWARTRLELTIVRKILDLYFNGHRRQALNMAFHGDVFGRSTKQGVSFRLGLTTCTPTNLCMKRCYAHDGRDASPQAVRRGALNTALAQMFMHEKEDYDKHEEFTQMMYPHVRQAVALAVQEAEDAKTTLKFRRSPRIRFSHVGDIARFPLFANWLAAFCIREAELTYGEKLLCVTYTRRTGDVAKLDPKLWRVLFSLDAASKERRKLIPKWAKKVWVGFDGKAPKDVLVSFAEHHGMTRMALRGGGKKCPSTLPGHPHGCDLNCCKICFEG